ncbi:MAG TPA: choice-of-anchor tandem repeat GloVer-containing protein [Candidatus Sulfotelmatobacter sp.]|nr:choice-of-anchor tandem repeat GloVer-containing protein [Candidatus Sulfotelmatobacter sp.]
MKFTKALLPIFAAWSLIFGAAIGTQAQTLTTLANFTGTNGDEPYYGSVIQASNGNYYGTTYWGGKNSDGVVFEVTPAGKLSVIYNFCSLTNCSDGSHPYSGLILAGNGDFYGTTKLGGANGDGTIFKMTLGGKLTTLYSFCAKTNCTDGEDPDGALVQASSGNFYGTTYSGGASGDGTVFEITQSGTFKTLYSFCSKTNCSDGGNPYSGLIQGANGNLYGTTYNFGDYHGGTAFEISTAGKFKALYSFCAQTNCADGENPFGGLTQGANGNLYGTTNIGGSDGYGTIFELTTAGVLTILHTFEDTDGGYPVSAPILASDGNFYGTTWADGVTGNGGTIYQVTSAGAFTSLYSFCSSSSCAGEYPEGALGQTTNGEFIGTTTFGGTGDAGTVYSYSTGLGAFVQTVPVAAKPGTRVVILGNDLTGATSVTFNGTSATFTVNSASEITVTVPTGATSGTVEVTTPAGTLKSNPSFQIL